MINTILFDLDGTLLPMDQDVFLKTYMGLLAKSMAVHGYEPEKLVKTVWAGTGVMIQNDGSVTNEEAFWCFFKSVYGEDAMKDLPAFEQFYANEFGKAQASCGHNPLAAELVAALKQKGYRLVLATNPLFPATATRQRTRWAGLDSGDFALVTTYENSRHCKPNTAYYQDILDQLGLKPEQCMMVGNDVGEDMVAGKLGMETYLLTDCLINKKGEDISAWRHGSMEELLAFVKEKM